MERNRKYYLNTQKLISEGETPKCSEYNFEYIWKHLLCGGISGMVSKTSVAPLDRVKILLQTHNHNYEAYGVFTGFYQVVKREGFFALYKGNGAQMVTIFPYAATEFTSFEIYKQLLAGKIGGQAHIDKFVAGAGAAATAIVLTYPLDTIRSRLAFQVRGEQVYTGIINVAQTIFRKEGGARGFYRGLVPTLISKVPHDGLTFYCFEYLKFACVLYLPKSTYDPCDDTSRAGLVLSIPAKLACGGFAAAAAQTIGYPLEVTRRMMQVSMMSPATEGFAKKGMIFSLRKVYRDHGIVKGLYRGVTLNFVRAVPMVVVSFTTYELLKQFLGLEVNKV